MAEKPIVLVADDDKYSRAFLKELLHSNGYAVDEAVDGDEAVEKINKIDFDLVLTDLKMPGRQGIEVLQAAKSLENDPEVLVVTAYGTFETAVEAIKLGAFDYLTKPLDSKRVLVTIQRALEKKHLRGEVANLRSQIEVTYGRQNIIAASTQMHRVLELVDLLAGSDSPVLIEGESGTGKELIVKAIHFGGARKSKSFVAVNCGALPEHLLESELFGHEKGAFTGAVKDKKGLFEEANGGTLLLDEIGDMPQSLQVKLLRVLQDGEVRRVGSNAVIHVDVRLISCTNRKLVDLIAEGKFREDLFYRLRVVPITVPPLRERREDIPPLLNHFVERFSQKMNKKVLGFTPEAMQMILSYDWPGNIRELENLVQGAITLSSSASIGSAEIEPFLIQRQGAAPIEMGNEVLNISKVYEKVEKDCIIKALQRNAWNQIQAARDLGIGRTTLWRKMEKHDIKKPS